MANIRKSFNFRSGLQVDTSNFIVNENGNVGVGTKSPATALEVNGAIKGGVNVSDKSADFTLSSSDNGNFINGTSASFDQISISSDLGSDFNCSAVVEISVPITGISK